MKRRTLYLPIETKAREFLGKALLAGRAVDRGWRVFLGGIEMHEYLADSMVPGLLIENNIPEGKASRLRKLKELGYLVADLCEESALYPDPEEFWTHKMGRRSLEAADAILVVGVRSDQDIRKYRPEAARRLVLTGNPRFDTLLPHVRIVYEQDAGAIRERYGRFLLVNSNFSSANPFKTKVDVVEVLQRTGKLTTAAQVERKRRQIAYKARQMTRLRTMLTALARAGAFDSIVVRPHPSENHDSWRSWASSLSIDVEYRGSAMPWILAADMVLHPGCTTAIEALWLDRPAVSFVPEPDSEFLNQADAVSARVANAGDLLALAETWGRTDAEWRRPHLAAGRRAMRAYIDNVEPPLAADRILDAADRLDVPETGTALGVFNRVRGALNVSGWSARRAALARTQFDYRQQKFPGLAPEEVRQPLVRWIEAGVVQRMPRITRLGGSLLRLQ